jgi:hypothetical protein
MLLSNKVKHFFSKLPYKINVKQLGPNKLPILISFVSTEKKVELIRL